MNDFQPLEEPWMRWWRFTVFVLGTLLLCSCTGPHGHKHLQPAPSQQARMMPPAAQAYPPAPAYPDVPLPYRPEGPWKPPGIAGPWPANEYLHDGGDRELPVRVDEDWNMYGIDPEDTVAQYETVRGEMFIEPSNRVDLYAPRFGAVRTVLAADVNLQVAEASGVHKPLPPVVEEDLNGPIARSQNLAAVLQDAALSPEGMRMAEINAILSQNLLPAMFDDRFKPYENLTAIRRGVIEQADKPFLAKGHDNAIAWTDNRKVQVVIDGEAALENIGLQGAQIVFEVEERRGAKLRLIKVASTHFAEPGDTVDFTLRFDNVGQEVLGNVVIVDNLTPRLAYVPDSSQSSVEAAFIAQPNEGGSSILRWEIDKPLEPGEGGILRFTCRVR